MMMLLIQYLMQYLKSLVPIGSVSIEIEVVLNVGDCVEVYWSREDTWYYEGEIIDLDTEDHTFKEVYYVVDNKKLWYKPSDYKCRFVC